MSEAGDHLIRIAEGAPTVAVRVIAEAAKYALRNHERMLTDTYAQIMYNAIIDVEKWARGGKVSGLRYLFRDVSRVSSNVNALYGHTRPVAIATSAAADAALAVAVANYVDDYDPLHRTLFDSANEPGVFTLLNDDAVVRHLDATDWLIDYSWKTVLSSSKTTLIVPQFPYVRGPLRIRWPRIDRETCWTVAELHARRKSRVLHEILVAIDAASEGVML